MVLQTDYSDNVAEGFPGMVANSEPSNIVSRTVMSATLAFGALALLAAVADDPEQHSVISASAETLEGIATANAGNTGNGVMGAVTVGATAKPGTYHLLMDTAASNAGAFIVEDPDGVLVGRGTVAVAFTGGGLSFTLADGATDFAAGDGFAIAVAPTSGSNVGAQVGIAKLDTTVGAEVASYEQGDTASIVTEGVVWVTAGGVVRAEEDDVYFVVSTGRYVASAAAGRIKVNNAKFRDPAAANGDLVRVALRKSNA